MLTDPWDYWHYRRAIKSSGLPPMVRLVLGELATIPGKGSDGTAAGPGVSIPHLAQDTGAGEGTVKRALRTARARGWLEPSGSPGLRNSYRLRIPADSRPVDDPADPGQSGPGTRARVAPDPGQSGPPLIPLYPEPSIDQRVRDRLRVCVPDRSPDDDEISALIKNLERQGVRNVPGYLHRCAPADVRRLLTEATQPAPTHSTTAEQARQLDTALQNREQDCHHGTPGGQLRTSAGTRRCPDCRREEAQQPHSDANRPCRVSQEPPDHTEPLSAALA